MENINKYSNTTIYQIICKDRTITDCYVGHTTNFKSRKREHKYCCNTPMGDKYSIKVYQFIRENGGFDNFDMILISTHVCEDIHEARQLERLCIEQMNPKLNDTIPGRTKKEYYEDNKDKLRQKQLEYGKRNKETISKHKKEYYNQHKLQIIAQRKERRNNNSELINEKLKAHRRELYKMKKEQLRHSNENQDCHDISKNLTIIVLIIIINLMHKHYINL